MSGRFAGISVYGCVVAENGTVVVDDVLDLFLDWVEANGMTFSGTFKGLTEADLNGTEPQPGEAIERGYLTRGRE